MSPLEGTSKVVCVYCETCSRYNRDLYVQSVSHLEWTLFLLFLEVEFYFLYVYNRFYEKKKVSLLGLLAKMKCSSFLPHLI